MPAKNKIFALILVIIGVTIVSPAPASAQVAGSVASCALGTAVSAAITGALTSLFGSSASSAVSGIVSDRVPTSNTELEKSSAEIEADENRMKTKAFTLDKLASCAAKALLHQMTIDVVAWINTGYKGRPLFLTNPQGFFLDAADQLTGEMISEDGPLRNMCSPWSVDIRIALALGQLQVSGNGIYPGKYTCTLGSIINNFQGVNVNGSIEGFVSGDFNQGGWPAFIALTTEDQNNPIGLSLQARSDQLFAIGKKQSAIGSDLQQSKGFLSAEYCEPASQQQVLEYNANPPDATSANIKKDSNGQWQECENKTPGSVIADSLSNVVQSPRVQLELANDINSVVSAVMTQLVNKVFSASGGLSSLSTGSTGTASGRQYLRRVNDELSSQRAADTAAANNANNPNPGIQILNTAIQSYDQALLIIGDSQGRLETARACIINKLPTLPQDRVAEATNQISQINTLLSTVAAPLAEALNGKRDFIIQQIPQGQPLTASASTIAALSATSVTDLSNSRAQAGLLNGQAQSFQNYCSGTATNSPPQTQP